MRKQVLAVLGNEDCVDRIASGVSPDRELSIVKQYAENLKAHMPRRKFHPRSFYSTVLDRNKNRTKYHMVYLTCHPKGIVEFARKTEETDLLQKKVRIHRRATTGGQELLFPVADSDGADAESVDYDKVKAYLMEKVADSTLCLDEAVLADMIEETGWLERVFQRSFGQMFDEGVLVNLDARGKRTKRFVRFDGQGERVRLG